MRILHTADWHVGKRLGRHDRMDDHAAVLDEIVATAEDESVDLVIVAGDLFDRPAAPIDALRLVLDALARLARPRRPVVAIAGNHDSAPLFDLLAPLLRHRNVHLAGAPRSPTDGGVLDLRAGDERALVATLPFLRIGQAVDFMSDADTWAGAYSHRMRALCAAYGRHLADHGADAVRLLTAHVLISGARLGGLGAPRGERTIHMTEHYTADATGLADGLEGRRAPHYVALGHVHAPQSIPRAPVPASYAGSPLELDFGEAGEDKRLVVVEVAPGAAKATERSVPLSAGRRLRRARGTWDELRRRDDLDDAYLDLTVVTDGPEPGLADRVRQAFPRVVKVRIDYERARSETQSRGDQPWDRLYRDYYRQTHETEAADELVAAFREIHGAAVEAP